ncbi:hypothetical protein EV122DRAFT_285571 [Schizophyllum commune]
MFPQRGTGYRHRPARLRKPAGSISCLGPDRRPFYVGIMALPGFPQFHAITAEFSSDQEEQIVVQFHSNFIQMVNGAVGVAWYGNVFLTIPPPLAAFRIETQDNQGNWAPVQFDDDASGYVLPWGRVYHIVVGGSVWEILYPQMQMARQATGQGDHNVTL